MKQNTYQPPNHTKRDYLILRRYMREHKTLEQIGKEFGLTRERVRQVLSHYAEYLNRPRKMNRENPTLEYRFCAWCGKLFTVTRSSRQRKCCSRDCLKRYHDKVQRTLTEKKCNRCKVTFPIEKFFKNTNGHPTAYCKKCCWLYSSEWRKRNPEKAREIQKRAKKKWTKHNRDKVNAHFRWRYANDPAYREKVLQYSREYDRARRAKAKAPQE